MRTEHCLAGLKRAWPVLLCTLLAGCGPLSEDGSSGASPQPDSLDELFAARGLALDAVTPAVGPSTGGIQLAITGSGFEPGARVTIADEPATQVIVLSGTRMVLSLPAKPDAWGKVPVVIHNPSGSEVTRTDLFGYHASYLLFATPLVKLSDSIGGVWGQRITTGDWNGDGRTDVLTTQSGTLAIALGDGHGNLGKPRTFSPIGEVAVGDFNSDGKLDVAVAGGAADAVGVRLGDGTGDLGEPTLYFVPGGASMLAAGDFNGDKKLDLLATARADSTTDQVSTLLGDGKGSFILAASTRIGGQSLRAQALADFNEDGKLDLAIGLSSSPYRIAVLLGRGDGSFDSPIEVPLVAYSSFYARNGIAVGDFNGDRHLDLATVSSYPQVISVYLGNGAGAFATGIATPWSGAYGNNRGLAAINLDGDQTDDLALTTDASGSPGYVRLFHSNGSGGFAAGEVLQVGLPSASLAVADLTGDQRPDLVVSLNNGNLVSLIHDGAQSLLGPQPRSSFPRLPPFPLAIADFDGDGLDDRLSPLGGGMSVYFASNTGEYVPGPLLPRDVNLYIRSVADVNGDGKIDLVATIGSVLSIQLGDGAGSFPAAMTYAIPSEEFFVGLTDLNRDRQPDAIYTKRGSSGTDATILVRLADGQGGFLAPSSIPTGGGASRSLLGDFSEDGVADLVIQTDLRSWSVFLGNGLGGFSTPTSFTGEEIIAVADWNGDGHVDFATQGNYPPFYVRVLLGDGNGRFSEAGKVFESSGRGTSQAFAIVRDFNGDQRPDLALLSPTGFELSVLLGDGQGGFLAPAHFSTGSSLSHRMRVEDVDGDGRPDFVGDQGVLLNLSR